MRIFLDSSVVLAACGSVGGASHAVCVAAETAGWRLLISPYVLEEVFENLADLPVVATRRWANLHRRFTMIENVLTLDRPVIFSSSKDRPVLFTALAAADVLLTLNQKDFRALLGGKFYQLAVLLPGDFVAQERRNGTPI